MNLTYKSTLDTEKLKVQFRQILAVGIVTQTGAYFFLASAVPRLGSSSPIATFATEQAAAAAAAKINSLLPLLPSCFIISKLALSPWSALVALATIAPLRAALEGSLVKLELELGRREAVMLIEAMSVCGIKGRRLFLGLLVIDEKAGVVVDYIFS